MTIREALMRAYVEGWHDGRARHITSDEGKVEVADVLAEQVEQRDDLLHVAALLVLHTDCPHKYKIGPAILAARATLAKAGVAAIDVHRARAETGGDHP